MVAPDTVSTALAVSRVAAPVPPGTQALAGLLGNLHRGHSSNAFPKLLSDPREPSLENCLTPFALLLAH